VDATLLYLILLSEYYRWTGDLRLLSDLRLGAEAAAKWIDNYGDVDKDNFVEYIRLSERLGLQNQGWKDSHNSVVFADGTLASPPIAMSEVQGYTYDAKCRFAELYPDQDYGKKLLSECAPLKDQYNDVFWLADKNYYAEALDKDKRKVNSITSNPCHGFWSGILSGPKADVLAKRIMEPDMFSGWGVRTLASSEVAYDPQSYHNGSVWPHDNSIIAWGLKKYGYSDEANAIITSLVEASKHFDYRLPELFCGYPRKDDESPVIYHSTCSPQAWASGSIILFIQTMLGLCPDAPNNVLYVKPTLPEWIKLVTVKNMVVGDEKISIEFRRVNGITTFDTIGKTGKIRIEPL
jgi:glycogen debranching enzyme